MGNPAKVAVWMLVFATLAWGASFPLMKAMVQAQDLVLPGRTSWFHSGLVLAWRFGLAAVLLFMWSKNCRRRFTSPELRQGIGLGVLAGAGVLLQADALNYTSASTSAFLTQFTCVLVPLVQSIYSRRAPSRIVMISCLTVMAGVAVLADVNWQTLRMGRGEFETLLSTTFFAVQILWLGRKLFWGNDMQRVTFVMFVTIAAILFPASAFQGLESSDVFVSWANAGTIAILALLTVFCSLIAFCLMNRWQPLVDPSHAGIIYCAEPLFTAGFALFLPELVSTFVGIEYPNERATIRLLVGGGLITLANILLIRRPGDSSNN